MHRLKLLSVTLFVVGVLVACGGDPPDSEAATERFVQCLERNGVTARTVNVELNDDGTVGTIEIALSAEANALYEPAIRLLCTDEVERDIG